MSLLDGSAGPPISTSNKKGQPSQVDLLDIDGGPSQT